MPQLTPFVRSDAIGAILAELFTHPERELSLSEIGRRSGVSGPVVHKEVSRLVDSGIAVDRQEGRNRLVRVNQEHALFKPMREIILATYGPVPVLRELFHNIEGVSQVFIYGSWAARHAGVAGAFPRDIDVLVVGNSPRRVLNEIAAQASARLDIAVNVTRLSPEEWDSSDPSAFVSTVKARPMFPVVSEGTSV